MNRARDKILPGARLARDENGDVARCGAADHLPDVEHRHAGPNERLARGVRPKLSGRRLPVAHEPLRLHGTRHRVEQHREIEGLGDVLEGTRLHRGDRPWAVAVRRRHDDGGLGPGAATNLPEKVEAVSVRQPHVEQHAVALARPERLTCLAEVGREDRLVPLRAHGAREPVTNAGLIVDDQHGTHWCELSPSRLPA